MLNSITFFGTTQQSFFTPEERQLAAVAGNKKTPREARYAALKLITRIQQEQRADARALIYGGN